MFELDSAACPIETEDLSASVLALTTALHERDAYTNVHCNRVCQLAHALGQRLGLDETGLAELLLAARFHDIGKIGIPDAVLLKPGRLDADEMAIMRSHPERGERVFLATGRDDAHRIGQLIRQHHEAVDGSGYPDGLHGTQIALGARILAVVDGFDAMTTTRPYRQSLPLDATLDILRSEAGARLDPQVLQTFIELLDSQPQLACL
jgi:HD-GYP domain-containing protein (c-di-GMP phosphodiesterase class II)